MYRFKAVWSGDIVELYEYERYVRVGDGGDRAGNRGKVEVEGCEVEEERRENDRERALQRARREVRRLINANVWRWYDSRGKPYRPVFLTLTFAENVVDVDVANYEFKKFRQRLEYELETKLKYVCVVEFQKRGAVHYHLVIFNLPYCPVSRIREIWRQGFVKINAISHCDNIGAYVTKYMTKGMDGEGEGGAGSDRLQRRKCYFSSRGLLKPIEKALTEKEIAELRDSLSQNRVYQGSFRNDYVGNIVYEQYSLNPRGKELARVKTQELAVR